MGDVELVGLYWTLSGPVEVHVGREWSLFEFPDRCAEAAKVGFSGIGIWHADLAHLLETRSLEELKAVLDANGVRADELEFLMDWWLDPGDERRRAADEQRRMIFEAAAVLEPHHIKVGNIPGATVPFDLLTERFAELCADAAEHHSAAIAYELMPFDPNVKGLDAAMALVAGAGARNGGIAIDTWHMGKLGIAPEELRRIPLEDLAWVELSDGRHEDMADPVDETINHRRLPGEGEFDVAAYVEVLRDHGYPGPWGVEVLSEELRNLPMEEIFKRAYETTSAQFRAGVA
jgi:sugar phosphate isomerase/epimerase